MSILSGINREQYILLDGYSENKVKVVEPDICHFLKFEKDETILTYKMWQNWKSSYFGYHIGMDGYRGLCPVFGPLELDDSIKQLLQKCIDSPADSVLIDKFADTLFTSLQPFDETVISITNTVNNSDGKHITNSKAFFKKIGNIKYYQYDISLDINIPKNVLYLKFLRETLCNPFIVEFMFSTTYDSFIKGLYGYLVLPLLENQSSSIANFKKFALNLNRIVRKEYPEYHKRFGNKYFPDWNLYEIILSEDEDTIQKCFDLCNKLAGGYQWGQGFESVYEKNKEEFTLKDFINIHT